ncbi:unnamed protein product [Effrenium voratum]|nr:unnamed protein product [Effrenium voratum]
MRGPKRPKRKRPRRFWLGHPTALRFVQRGSLRSAPRATAPTAPTAPAAPGAPAARGWRLPLALAAALLLCTAGGARFGASQEDQRKVEELVDRLAQSFRPVGRREDLLRGSWKLIYSTSADLTSLDSLPPGWQTGRVGQSFLTSRYARNEIDFFSPLGKVVQEVNCTWKPRDEEAFRVELSFKFSSTRLPLPLSLPLPPATGIFEVAYVDDELLIQRTRLGNDSLNILLKEAESDPEDAELEEAKLHKQARIRDWLQRKEVELHQRRQRQRAEEEQMRELQELEDQRKEEHQAQLLRERQFRLRCAALRQKELDLELEQHRAFPPEARVQAVGAQTLAAYSTPRIGRKHARCRSARAQRLETDTRPQLCGDLAACG